MSSSGAEIYPKSRWRHGVTEHGPSHHGTTRHHVGTSSGSTPAMRHNCGKSPSNGTLPGIDWNAAATRVIGGAGAAPEVARGPSGSRRQGLTYSDIGIFLVDGPRFHDVRCLQRDR